MVRPTVNSTKHYNQFSPTNIGAGAISNLSIIDAVALVDVNDADEVREGAIVKAVYIELWATSNDTSQGSFQCILEKIPAGATPPTFTTANSLTAYDNKKNIFYVTRGLTSVKLGTPIPLMRGWYKIPKGKQRFGLGDTLRLDFSAIAGTITFCGFFLFKEYY